MRFTYKYWEDVCILISALNSERGGQSIIVKHDVECNSGKALEIAKISSQYNIRSVYYFQIDVFQNNINIAKKIEDLGHTIGYHYDVLDQSSGNYKLALDLFRYNLKVFSDSGFEIRHICPHGNPTLRRDGWNSNKDFMRNEKIRFEFDFLEDIVIDFKKLDINTYVSDAGYGFKEIGSISSNDVENIPDKNITLDYSYFSTAGQCLLSTHPHRWCDNDFEFIFKKLVFFTAKKLYKIASIIPGMNYLFDGLYFLARRF